MRRLLFALTLSAVALAAAACSADTAPGWTYAAPTEAPSAAASSGASAAPGGSASAAPGGSASAAPSGSGAGGAVQISALNIAFEQTSVTAPADAPFTINFNNKEAVPHNVDVKDSSGASKFKGDVFSGPKEVDYQVPALSAGDYTFVCDVHANMTGTLKVGG
jgi:AsmA family protein